MNYVRKDGYKANASKSGMIVLYNEYKEEHLPQKKAERQERWKIKETQGMTA